MSLVTEGQTASAPRDRWPHAGVTEMAGGRLHASGASGSASALLKSRHHRVIEHQKIPFSNDFSKYAMNLNSLWSQIGALFGGGDLVRTCRLPRTSDEFHSHCLRDGASCTQGLDGIWGYFMVNMIGTINFEDNLVIIILVYIIYYN